MACEYECHGNADSHSSYWLCFLHLQFVLICKENCRWPNVQRSYLKSEWIRGIRRSLLTHVWMEKMRVYRRMRRATTTTTKKSYRYQAISISSRLIRQEWEQNQKPFIEPKWDKTCIVCSLYGLGAFRWFFLLGGTESGHKNADKIFKRQRITQKSVATIYQWR